MHDDNSQSTSAPRGRRRGAHNVTLNASARLALTQHFALKGRAQPPPDSDPVTRNIRNYYAAPLGARLILEAVIPLTHDRHDLSADTVYFNHPSAREDLQHPLLLEPATQSHIPVNIENYYITGVYSNIT